MLQTDTKKENKKSDLTRKAYMAIRQMLFYNEIPHGPGFSAKCDIQVKMLQELFDVLLLRYSRDLFFLSVTDTSLSEHIKIFQSVENRDETVLEASLRFHVNTVRNHIIKGMTRLIVVDKKEFL